MDTELAERLNRIEAQIESLVRQRTVKDWYTTAEVAVLLGRSQYTIREWCRGDRIVSEKRACGRGCNRDWMISHNELLRIQNHGLLPTTKTSSP